MSLRAVPDLPHRHDLPPLWDGRKVEWQGWTHYQSSMRFHRKPEKCDNCGDVSGVEPSINLGIVAPLPGEKMTVPREVKSKRSGREYVRNVEVDAWPLIQLVAFRCANCGHDQVHDQRTDEWWDLDEQDYGDEGSTDGMLF